MACHSTSTAVVEKHHGTHQFKIIGFNQKIYDFPVSSGTFNIGGYSWRLVYYPRTHDLEEQDDDEYIEVDLELLSPAEVTTMVDLFLINQTTNVPHREAFTNDPVTLSRARIWRTRKLKKMSELENNSPYVLDNSIIIECQLTVIHLSNKMPKTMSICEIKVPPPEMVAQFSMLLEDMDSADVTFLVGGETFHAHRLVLAVRSPVFKAQLFGPMKESGTQSLTICEMQPAVFKLLLHYIYTESLPSMYGDDKANKSYDMLCHLLKAADRYGIERLKAICERMLWIELDVVNVSMTLALADQHHCHQLKEACLEFMELLMEFVVTTKGYKQLKRDFPSLLFEVWERSVRPRRSKD
ncbi:hypothetical protein ACP4OV_018617 [Aristida adscensionis]